MADREKVINGLECCATNRLRREDCEAMDCAYLDLEGHGCIHQLIRDALALLKMSFTPQEVYETVIEHAQHDKRFKLGDKIDYSFTDVVDILNIELMCKAGDM